ncbi:MAG: MltA domain-containing protein [Deltaproteobacteria bacterium]|nr:MltA domain-containing protein [Deltaproteobacteria bacterium]
MRFKRRYGLGVAGCTLLLGLAVFFINLETAKLIRPQKALQMVAENQWPVLSDDLDLSSLQSALERNLVYLRKLSGDSIFSYGVLEVNAGQVLAAQSALLAFLQKKPAAQELESFLRKNFVLLESVRSSWLPWQKNENPVLFTGYYVPILHGSRHPDQRYRYPLYRRPSDLVVIESGRFDLRRYVAKLWPWLAKLPFGPRLEELCFPLLRGRLLDNGRVVPYHTRAEIDYAGKLKGEKLELLWVDDEVDRFFLQIQGSGLVRLTTGKTVMVGYAEANGHPYRSIGGWLIEQGLMERGEVSMPSIRAWIKSHPERMAEIFKVNPSYVFFRELPNSEALGCYDVPISAGRSIATDRNFFPGGALALISTTLPTFSPTDEVAGWRPCNRLVFNQDTGGAIKGPFRVDLYCGADKPAELTAGVMKQPGRLFFFVPR